jgi:tetratricopeptide (TPR) repeat protein
MEKMGKIEEAIVNFSEVLKSDPNHVNAAFAKAACLNKIAEYGKAIEAYKKAFEIDEEEKKKRKMSKKSEK